MKKLFTILAVAVAALALSSCEKISDLFDPKIKIEGSQWELVNAEAPSVEWGKLIALYDIGYTQKGTIYNAIAVVESSDEEIPVGKTIVSAEAKYEISYDEDGNPTRFIIKVDDSIEIIQTIKVIDKDYFSLSLEDQELKLHRIANPYKLDLSTLVAE